MEARNNGKDHFGGKKPWSMRKYTGKRGKRKTQPRRGKGTCRSRKEGGFMGQT